MRFLRRMYHRPRLDPWLLGGLLMLMLIGLITLYSAADKNVTVLINQSWRFAAGLLLMLIISYVPPNVLRLWSPWLYAGSVLMLGAVAVLGVGYGATRWLDLGIVRFQPSELLKITAPMLIAWYLHARFLPPQWKDICISLLFIGLPVMLIAQQPDLGTAILVGMAGAFVLFLAGIGWRYLVALAVTVASVAPLVWHVLHDYQRQRVLTFLNPESDPLGTGWHIIQSKIAVGSGGLLGKGFYEGTQSRLNFLPEHTTDFIFSTFAEEFGLWGVSLLLLTYMFVIARGVWIASRATDVFSRLICGAVSMSLFVYVIVNGGMVTGILPVVGIPLPLVSYGGTSAVTLFAGFGILFSVYAHRSQKSR